MLCAVLVFFAEDGDTVVVTVDGEEYARLSLEEDTELEIVTPHGKNILTVKDGNAYMSFADCPDKVCVSTGKATPLRSVVCLPHRVTVSVEEVSK